MKKYNTNPNTDDSDDDNITDYDEIKLDLSPISKQSDGITLDNQRTFNHTFSHSSDFLSDINNDDNPYLLSIEIASAGNVENALSIQIGGFSDVINNISIVGEPVTLSYKEDLKVDTVKIEFKPKEIDENIENYMIFKYFPRTNYLLPVETKYTQDSAYIETDEVGTYCLVNTKYRVQDDFTVNNTPHNNDGYGAYEVVCDYELGETEVIFFVDVSGALLEEKNFEETKKSIHNFSQAVFDHSANSTVQIFGYYSNPYNYDAGLVPYTDSNNYPILCSMNSVDEATDKISNCIDSKNNNLDYAILLLNNLCNDDLFTTECNNRYAFIISDSTYTFTDRIGYKSSIPRPTKDSLQSIFDNNVHLNFLLSPDNYKCKSALENLEDICEPYAFNIIEKSKTPGFTDDKYASIYSDAAIKLDTFTYFFSYSINPDTIPEKVERNAFINSLPPKYSNNESLVPEADSDGNIDFKEAAVAVGAAKYDEFDNLIFETLYDACNISDITAKGYEQFMEKKNISDSVIASNIQITPFSDKILYADNDKDGLANKDDPYPDKPFDDRFEIVSDYSYEPTIDFVEKRYQNSQDCYDSTIDTIPILGTTAYILFTISRDSTILPKILEKSVLDYTIDFGLNPERKNNSQVISRACDAMKHYFSRSGKEVIYSQSDTCELISSSAANLMHLFDNLNSTMRCAEGIVMDGNSIIISPKCNQKFKAVCFGGTKAGEENTDTVECNININNTGLESHSEFEYCNYVHRDWQITIGEAAGTIIAEIERNGDTFNMKYRYYFKDIYEWAYHYDKDPKDISAILHAAHECGDAQEYLMQGYYEGNLSWTLNDKITDKAIAEQIFMTLCAKEGGLGNNPSTKWTQSNEIERFKQILSTGE